MSHPIKHCRLIEIRTDDDSWAFNDQPKGKREKRRCIPLKTEPPLPGVLSYYYKTSLDWAPLEFWSEVLAYHLGHVFGVEVPVCFPCLLDGRPGCLAQDMLTLQDDSELVHGADLLMLTDDQYIRNGKGERHSAQAIMKIFRMMEAKWLYHDFFRTLLLDALIGNSDRHHENWGVLSTSTPGNQPPIFRLTPAYDNGSSLLRNYEDAKIQRTLNSKEGIERYARKGKSVVLWQERESFEQLDHIDLIRRHVQNWRPARDIAVKTLSFTDAAAEEAVHIVSELSRHSLPEVNISEIRERCILNSVLVKRELLLQAVTTC